MDQKTDIILIILSIVISVSIVLTYVVYRLEKTVDEEIKLYKEENTRKVKQKLKNYVDIAYSLVHSNYTGLIKIVDDAEDVLKEKSKPVEGGKLKDKAQAEEAADAIKQISSNDGMRHIWIIDTTDTFPKMIMHPKKPQLNEKILDASNLGKNLNVFVKAVELLKKKDDGFIKIKMNKEENKEDLLHDVFYVRLFRPWNWVIIAGFNIEDSMKTKKEIENVIRNLTYDDGAGYFWVTNNDENSPQLLVYPPDPSREKKKLEGKYAKHEALVQSFIDVVKSQSGSKCDHINDSAKKPLKFELGDYLNRWVNESATLIQSLIDVVKSQSNLDDADVPPKLCRGYLEYGWDKPTSQGTIRDVKKLSYVKLYEPLDVIIGTGVYMDDVNKTIAVGKRHISERIDFFEYKIVIGAILIIFFIGALNYILNYFYFQYLRQSFNSLFSKMSYQRNLFRGLFLKKSFKRNLFKGFPKK